MFQDILYHLLFIAVSAHLAFSSRTTWTLYVGRSQYKEPLRRDGSVAGAGSMFNARKKIVKEKGATPNELEEEVAKALLDLETSSTSAISGVEGKF